MTTQSVVRLSPAQWKILEAVAKGHVTRMHSMGWFQKGGFCLRGGRNPAPATVEKLHDLDLVRYANYGPGADIVIVTDKGKAWLNARP